MRGSVLIHSSSLFLINAVEHMVLFRTKFGSKKVGRPKSVKRKCANITNRVTFSFARSFTRSLIRSFVRSFVLQEKYLVSHNCIPGFVLASDQAFSFRLTKGVITGQLCIRSSCSATGNRFKRYDTLNSIDERVLDLHFVSSRGKILS